MRILLRDLEVGMKVWACLDEPPVPTLYEVKYIGPRAACLVRKVVLDLVIENWIDSSDELFLDEKSCWLDYRESLRKTEEAERARLKLRYDEMHRRCNARLEELSRMTACEV